MNASVREGRRMQSVTAAAWIRRSGYSFPLLTADLLPSNLSLPFKHVVDPNNNNHVLCNGDLRLQVL